MRTAFVLVIALGWFGCKEADDAENKARSGAKQAYGAGQSAYAAGRDAVGLARTVKSELDKVYKTDHAYDLDITRAGASKDHAAKLSSMPHVTVRGVTVGYEETATRSINGVGYKKHFRATWRRGGEDVIVSYATQDDIDIVAFARLVEKMVPIVEKAID